MAPLAARRLEAMVELGARVVSIELMLAAQACDLRGARLGAGTAARARRRAATSSRSSARASSLPGPRAARRRDPLRRRIRWLTMAGVDVHQHLLPAGVHRCAAPAARRRPAPRRRAPLAEGTYAIDLAEHDLETRHRAARPRTGSTSPSSRCSRRSGSTRSTRRSARSSAGLGGRHRSSSAAAPAGGSRRSPRAGRAPASRALRRRRTRSTTSTRSRRSSTRCAGRRLPVRPPVGRLAPPAAAPAWWPARSSTTRRRCSARTSPGSRRRRSAGPTSRSSSRSSPAAAPFQLERLASRGVDVRSVAPPQRLLRHGLLRPARARALHRDVRRRAARLRQRRARRRSGPHAARALRASANLSHISSVRTTRWTAVGDPDRDMAATVV